MNNIINYNNIIVYYNLIAKFNFKNIFQIPKFKKITLNIGLKNLNNEKKKIIPVILLLKIITNQKIKLTKSSKNKIILKIKKGSIVGCKVTLRKKNLYVFLEKLIIFNFFNNIKINKIKLKNKNIIDFKLKKILEFFELKKEFLKFQHIDFIDVSIYSDSKTKNLFLNLLNHNFFLKN